MKAVKEQNILKMVEIKIAFFPLLLSFLMKIGVPLPV